jgi:hypothetical protein
MGVPDNVCKQYDTVKKDPTRPAKLSILNSEVPRLQCAATDKEIDDTNSATLFGT